MTDTREAALLAAERALDRAVQTIRDWHSMGIPKPDQAHLWSAYQASPEMQTINAGLSAVTAALSSTGEGWQTIETAPKDGTWILLRGVNSAGRPMIPVVAAWCPPGSKGIGWKDSGTFKNVDDLAVYRVGDKGPTWTHLPPSVASVAKTA